MLRPGARSKDHVVRELKLGELAFDPILHEGYEQSQVLEPDLLEAQRQIHWAEHLVFVYPVWWGGLPALLQGFFDRALQPGFAPLPRHPGQGLGATAGRAQRRPAGLPRPAAVAAALPQARRRTGRWCAACSAPVASPPAAWKSSRRCAVPARNSARAGCVAPNSSAARSGSLPARLRPGADTDRSDRSATFPPACLPRPHGGPFACLYRLTVRVPTALHSATSIWNG